MDDRLQNNPVAPEDPTNERSSEDLLDEIIEEELAKQDIDDKDMVEDDNPCRFFNDALDTLNAVIGNAKAVPLKKGFVMVESSFVLDIINDMHDNLPFAVDFGMSLIKEKDRVKDSAKNEALNIIAASKNTARNKLEAANIEANSIRASAEQYAEETKAAAENEAAILVSENVITERAREEADRILTEANAKAASIVNNAKANTAKMLEMFEKEVIGFAQQLATKKSQYTTVKTTNEQR